MDQYWRKHRRSVGERIDDLRHPVVGWSLMLLGVAAVLAAMLVIGASLLTR